MRWLKSMFTLRPVLVSFIGSLAAVMPATVEGVSFSVLADTDGAGVPNRHDNCRNAFKPDQADADGNGVGDVCKLGVDADGYTASLDCYDDNATVYPRATDPVDGLDNDFDGLVDEV